jgi:hypothetical protein
MPARKPFPSRTAAIEALENLSNLAGHGLARLELKYRIDAPSVRKQITEAKRGLKMLIRGWNWRAP